MTQPAEPQPSQQAEPPAKRRKLDAAEEEASPLTETSLAAMLNAANGPSGDAERGNSFMPTTKGKEGVKYVKKREPIRSLDGECPQEGASSLALMSRDSWTGAIQVFTYFTVG